VGRPVSAAAVALFVVVIAIGVAEIHLLGMPRWLDVVYVAFASVMVADDYFRRRAKPAEDKLARESCPSPAPPAPAGAPDAFPAAPRRQAQPHPAEPFEQAEPEEPAPGNEDVSAAAREANGSTAAIGLHACGANGSAADAEPTTALRTLGYTCVPPDDKGRELASDTEKITAWCADSELPVPKMVHDVESPKGQRGGSPALHWALDQIATGEADTLVVPRLRDLAPNVAKLPPLLRWFTESEHRLVAIDLELDTATDAGRLAAFALAGVGSWENERLSARTREGLEAARSRGAGRAASAVADVPELSERIVRMRNEGKTLQAIADVLNQEGVPTVRGGAKWRPSSVQRATGYHRPTSTRGIQLPQASGGAQHGRPNQR
jgi:DNA invertase Pin-like site-specific DNA recombinase